MVEAITNRAVEPVRWLLVGVIAYTLATGIWFFFETPTGSGANPVAPQERSSSRAPHNVNWILAQHLFGEAGAPPKIRDSGEPPPEITRLPLELQSVFVADETEFSAAIIAQKGKSGKLYAVGDDVPGGAELIDVATTHVVLRRAGARESLPFPKPKSGFSLQPVDQANDAPGSGSASNPGDIEDDFLDEFFDEDQQAIAEGRAVPGDEDIGAEDPAAAIEDFRDRVQQDASGALGDLGIESVGDGDGYRIGDVSSNPYLRQTGLQPGDVILSVNGRSVGNIQQDQLELENIMAQGSARIEVQRGSRRFFITASLK